MAFRHGGTRERRRMMKRVLYSSVLLMVGLFFFLSAGLAQQAAGPRIEIEEKGFDAREVKEGEVIEHTFTVNNRGEEVLEIRKVSPG
jgi:uncharacterized protein (DUF58 family)